MKTTKDKVLLAIAVLALLIAGLVLFGGSIFGDRAGDAPAPQPPAAADGNPPPAPPADAGQQHGGVRLAPGS